MTPLDEARLLQAHELAEAAVGLSDPNPRVGCVIGREDGQILGRGHTQRAGGPHAEVMALRDARQAGHVVAGATAWVTLEPCAHHGRTPPCCDALIEAGIGRVVASCTDPFPRVAGTGFERLRGAGVRVEVAGGAAAERCRAINPGFFSRIERGRPWVRVKVACSLDGKSALANGVSQWITGPEARADGHRWRKRASAVLSGIGTVLTDDPRLDVRLVATEVQPVRVILDSRLRMPPKARVLAPPGACWIFTTGEAAATNDLPPGTTVIPCASDAGRVSLTAVLGELAAREINEIHVEAGPALTGNFLCQGLADELLVYMAPMVIGPGRDWAQLPGLARLDEAFRCRIVACRQIGNDLQLILRPGGQSARQPDAELSEFLTPNVPAAAG